MSQLHKLLLSFLFLLASGAQALPIDSLFLRIPMKVLPLLERNARLDMLDYYNAGMKAVGENTLGGQAVLVEKASDRLRIEVTPATIWEMRELTTAPHDTTYVVINSIRAAGVASRLSAYQANWHAARVELPHVTFNALFHLSDSLSKERCLQLRELLQYAPIEARWESSVQVSETAAGVLPMPACPSAPPSATEVTSHVAPTADVLTFSVCLDSLSPDDRPDALRCLRKAKYVWQGGKFVMKGN